MKSILKSTLNAAYFLSPIFIICFVSILTLGRIDKKEVIVSKEKKEARSWQ